MHTGLAAATELTFGASEIGQWVSMFAVMPEDMGSVPGTHMVERQNQLPQNCHLTSSCALPPSTK